MMDQPIQHAALDATGIAQPRLARRTILGATLAGTAAAIATPAAHATAASSAGEKKSARFAMIADTHVNTTNEQRTRDLRRTLTHIESRNPDFVLHCGDITEWGSAEEVELYRSSIPSRLRSRMHHVPGNHESQWNADAWESYREAFGPTHYSFDAAGLHVIAMDPVESQEWPAFQFGQRLLDDVRADLENVPSDVPVVLLSHFPISDNWLYVNNVEEFLRVIEPHRVRLMFSGHAHRTDLRTFNGLTHLVGDALKQAPVYYWAERVTDADGDRLTIHEVRVPASGKVQEKLLTHAPLGDSGPGDQFGPLDLQVKGGQDEITVQAAGVPEGGRARAQWPSRIKARIYPQGVLPTEWTTLERRGRGPTWHGVLDASSLPPGSHRIQVQASDAGKDPVWNQMAPVSVPTTDSQVAWSHPLAAGTVMAGLAQHDATVVAGSTEGVVEALTVDAGGASSRWRRNLGGIYKSPVFASDGDIVLVGSADHHLYALDAATGRTVWRRDLGAPVQCELALLDLPQGKRVGVAAGSTLFVLDLDGAPVWQADLGGSFTGRACAADGLVHAGSSDGKVHAFDAKTGRQEWSSMVATKIDSPYHLMIYGPWAAPLQATTTGDVFVPAHTGAAMLNARTGAVQWTVDGLHRAQLTRPVVSEFGILVFDGKKGDALLLDATTGETTWHDNTLPFVPGSGASGGSSPIPTEDPAVHWMVATTGVLVRIDLSRPEITPVLKVSNTFTTSTPGLATADGRQLLVTVDHPGQLRGITGLPQG